MFEEYQNAKDYAKVYRGENVMKRGIATYQDEAIFLSQDTLHRDMETLKGRPVVIKHQNVTPENMEEKAVGYVTDTFYNNEAGTFGCKFVIFDDEAKELIRNGYSLSTCYKPTSFGAGGTEINTPYDREVTGLVFTHLALVPDPRYEDAKIYENGIMEMDEEILLNGGEGSGDFDHAGRPGEVGGSEPAGTGRDGKYTKSGSQNWVGKKPEQKKLFDEEIGEKRKTQFNYGVKVRDKETNKKGIIIGSVPRGIDPDTQKKLYLYEIKWDNGEIERKSSTKVLTGTKKDVPFNIKGIHESLKEEFEKGEISAEEVAKELYHAGWSNYILDNDEALKRIGIKTNKKQNAIIEEQERKNTMENEKMEIPVTFFDKIMDLICNSKKEKKNEEIEDVIEKKEEIEAEDEKENKCKKNEVVDKRDILRQIMAIAGKHEDNEDVRTIAKLAEKLAYDKDEAEKENSKEDLEYNNDEFFNAVEKAKSLGESDKLPIPETQAKQLERGKQIFG